MACACTLQLILLQLLPPTCMQYLNSLANEDKKGLSPVPEERECDFNPEPGEKCSHHGHHACIMQLMMRCSFVFSSSGDCLSHEGCTGVYG